MRFWTFTRRKKVMALKSEYQHRWGTYLSLNNKRDLKGKNLTDQQQLELNPYSPIWDERANHTALHIRHCIGDDAYMEFLNILPEETDHWSPQKFSFAFDRVLLLIDQAGVNSTPGPVELAIAACAGPVSIHPYEMAKLKRACPECGASISPHLIDPDGYLVRCDACGFVGHFQDDRAVERWKVHVEEIKERFFAHLVKD
jgi:hypothetical protein